MRSFFSHIKSLVVEALNQINQNCGWPNNTTTTWSNISENSEQEIFYISKPPENGYSDENESFTQSEMISGVVNVEEAETLDIIQPVLDTDV